MIRIGIIGYGYWGPNVVRNFYNTEGIEVTRVCDINPEVLQKVKKSYSSIDVTTDYKEITCASDVDAVAIVTPVCTHYKLVRESLQEGKHVFVEKPFTYSLAEAEELVDLAARKNLTVMVDHTFLFTGAVRKIKELIDNSILGNLYYFDSMRVNLGIFQHDINVIWDLAPHDLSIMDYLIEEKPTGIMATGQAHLNSKENIAFILVYFSSSLIAHFNVNWLSPVKVRNTLISGDRKMLVWNDLDADEKIRIYDKGIDVQTPEDIYNLRISYRSGDMWVPKVEQTEALKLEAEHFADCIEHNKAPINDGLSGMRIVKYLEAANRSLKNKSEMIAL